MPILVYPQKVNIAILQFDAANISEAEVRILTDRLRTELIRLGSYNVVERAIMEDVLREQGFQQSGCVTTECVVEVGKLVGVEQMVAGSIGRIGSLYTISARIVDVETGTVISQTSLDCPCSIETVLTESMAEIAATLSGVSGAREPPTGSIVFLANIDSVKVYSFEKTEFEDSLVEDYYRGVTPLLMENQKPGEYKYLAVKSGYRDFSGIYTIKPGVETTVNIELEKEIGSVTITSNIDSTLIIIGYDTIGYTPIQTFNIYAGEYQITAIRSGYRTYQKLLKVADGENIIHNIKLSPKNGQLVIDSKRPGQYFDIIIGDTVYKHVNRKVFVLREGAYQITIREWGYYDYKKEIVIKDNSIAHLYADNEKILTPIIVKIHPEEAKLTLNGNRTIKPESDLSLPFGTYSLEATAPKYEQFANKFSIQGQDTIHLNIRLKPKSKIKAIGYSSLIPGSGQLYLENGKRGNVFIFLSIGSVALMSYFSKSYIENKHLMNQYRDDYKSARTAKEINLTKQLYQKQVSHVNDTREKLVVSIVVVGSVWLANIIDVYLTKGIPDE